MGSSDLAWGQFVDLGEYRIKTANTAETGAHRDRCHGEVRLVEKTLCALNSGGFGYFDSARAEVRLKETAQVPCANTEPRRKRIDAIAIESAPIDQSERAFDRGPRSFPCRRERSRLGPAPEAWAISGSLCRGGRRIEGDVLGLSRAHRAHRSTIDPRCADA